jgi:hypothetical protein
MELLRFSIAVTVKAYGEATPGTEVAAPKAAPQLWEEGLWDEDEATRMFMLATNHPSLNGPQTRLWTLLSGSILANGKKLNLKTFREYYSDPSIDTKHLQTEEGA